MVPDASAGPGTPASAPGLSRAPGPEKTPSDNAVVAAVFLSNFPESLASSVGMKKSGHSTRYILALWAGVLLTSTVAAAVGYVALDGAPQLTIALIQGFAAGAILVMLSDTMLPEAVGEGGSVVGLVTTVGFVLAFLLSNS